MLDHDSYVDRVLQVGLSPSEALKQQILQPEVVGAGADSIFRSARHKVCLLFTSRSGTTFFVDVLNKTGEFGTIREHMNGYMIQRGIKRWSATTLEEYLRKTVSRSVTPNGVFGFKGTVEALLPLVQVGELPENVHDWHWITVRRDDVIAQAVSLYRAKTTGVWHRKTDDDEAPTVPKYDFDGIAKQVTLIQRKQGQIERFFARFGLEPLRLVYEDFRDDPTDALHAVFRHAGLEPPEELSKLATASDYQVLRNRETDDYVERFRSDLGRQLSSEQAAVS